MGFWNETKKKKSEIENEERQALKRNVDVTEHKDELEDLLSKLETSADYGLSTSMVKHKHQIFGPNRLTPPKQVPKWMKFIQELTGFFSLLVSFVLFLYNSICAVTFLFIFEKSNVTFFYNIMYEFEFSSGEEQLFASLDTLSIELQIICILESY